MFTEPKVYVDSVVHNGTPRANSLVLGWERWGVSKTTPHRPTQAPLFGLTMLARPPIDDSANSDADESNY